MPSMSQHWIPGMALSFEEMKHFLVTSLLYWTSILESTLFYYLCRMGGSNAIDCHHVAFNSPREDNTVGSSVLVLDAGRQSIQEQSS